MNDIVPYDRHATVRSTRVKPQFGNQQVSKAILWPNSISFDMLATDVASIPASDNSVCPFRPILFPTNLQLHIQDNAEHKQRSDAELMETSYYSLGCLIVSDRQWRPIICG